MFLNEVTDSIRHQESRVPARRDQIANFGRRDLELRYGMDVDTAMKILMQIVDAMRAASHNHVAEFTEVRRFPARPVRDNDMGEIKNLIPAMPACQPQECVHTNNQTQRCIRAFFTNLGQRVDCVRRPCTPKFAVVDDEPGLSLRCKSDHLQPHSGRRERLSTMRWITAGHEPDFAEAQRLQHFECRSQVSVMNWIERAAEYPDRVHRVDIPRTISVDSCQGSARDCPFAA